MTVFLNSHLLSEVEQVCDRVAIVDRGRVVADGTLDELLHADSVRIHVTDLPRGALETLGAFGRIDSDGDWLVARGLAQDRVHELVAELVRMGARVHAVEPQHETLEDRFLRQLGGA